MNEQELSNMKPDVKKAMRIMLTSAKRTVTTIMKLRKLGASNYEIAKAVGIPEDSPLMQV